MPLEFDGGEDDRPIFRVFDVRTGKAVATISGRPSHTSIHWSGDGAQVALVDSGDIRLFDIETGRYRFVLDGHNETVLGVKFVDAGRRLVSAGSDDTVRAWDLTTGKELFSLGELRDTRKGVSSWEVRPVNVASRDGRTLLLLRSDGKAQIWRLPATVEESTQAVRKAVARCLTRNERESAQLDARPPEWCISSFDDSRDVAPQLGEGKWPFRDPVWTRWLSAVRRNLDPPLPGTEAWKKWSADTAGK